MKGSGRTLLVVALLLVAAGIPCTYWFVTGSREADRESRRVLDEARDEARLAARTAAAQLGVRLEKLRAAESQRPYFHYQNLMHDPRGASEGLSVVPSPLAAGPADPLILAHFQLDRKGTVSMPTLNDEVRELSAPDAAVQRSMRHALSEAAPQLLRAGDSALASLETDVAGRRASAESAERAHLPAASETAEAAPPATAPAAVPREPPPATHASASPKPTRTDLSQTVDPWPALQNNSVQNVNGGQINSLSNNVANQSLANQSQIAQPPPLLPPKVEQVDPQTFAQNSQSNIVYQELKTAPARAPRVKAQLPPRHAPRVEIATGDFAWSDLDVAGSPTLGAIRPVVTPDGSLLQGFLISGAAVAETLRSAGPAAPFLRLRQGGSASPDRYPIGASGWSIEVDDGAAAVTAGPRAAAIRTAFQRTFAGGIAAVALALIAVSVLVSRTERLARERSQFAAAAAHELRTPLAGIRLYGDMLAHQLGNPERSRLYATHVSEEAERLGRVVTNMLELSRLERGSFTVKPQPGDLGVAVRECIEQLRPTLEAAGCTLTLQVAESLPPVAFDRDAVHQIVQNLVDNAEKYSRPGSERSIDVEVVRLTGGAGILVNDRGLGIDPQVARRLFVPFKRGGAPDSPAGLGLGLALVKALAEAQKGEVTFLPRSGGGTTFRVTLPAA